MTYKITKSTLIDDVLINLPASKSLSNRALIMQGLCQGSCSISHLSDCDDTTVMLNAHSHDTSTYIYEDGYRIIDIGAAGTSMRFLTAFFSAKPGAKVIMTGSQRMRQRPISVLVDALRALGADIEYTEIDGFPPLRIKGKRLEGGHLEIDGSISSQYISALLMIAPTLQQGLELHLLNNVTSIPYIRMTLSMMEEFGIKSTWNKNVISIAPQEYNATTYAIESDWSAASYWYEILALSNSIRTIRLKGLRLDSTQGDCHIADYFSLLGVRTESCDEGVRITRTDEPLPEQVSWDMSNQPDLAQTVIASCCALRVNFDICGLHTLRIKETDRITALENELLKLGFIVGDNDDREMMWKGETTVPTIDTNPIATYQDHRMAMAFAPLALVTADGSILIDNPQVVTKSYPTYWNDIQSIGFAIQES